MTGKSETVVCKCGNALWEVTKCEAGSFTVDFRCRCTSCGAKPTPEDTKRLYYGLSFQGFMKVRENIWTHLFVTATHLFCMRCFKEDRTKLHDFDHKAGDDLWEDSDSSGGGWIKLEFRFTDIDEFGGAARIVLCDDCATKEDLVNWITETFRVRSDLKISSSTAKL